MCKTSPFKNFVKRLFKITLNYIEEGNVLKDKLLKDTGIGKNGQILEEILIMKITRKLKNGWKKNMTPESLIFVKETLSTLLQNVYENKELMIKMLLKKRIQCLCIWEFSLKGKVRE